MDINNTFSERLKAKRVENGFSQNALAGKIGISRSLYNKYERAGIRPSHEILILLAKELKTTTDYLVGNIDTANDLTQTNKKEPPPFTEEDILQMLADKNNLSEKDIEYLKQTIRLLEATNKARQISERLKEETSDELSPESN